MSLDQVVEMSVSSKPVFTYEIKEGDDVIATAQLYIMESEKGEYGRIENVFVNPEYRGQGLGTTLSRHVLRESESLGHYKCTLATSKPNAAHIYAKLGFYRRGDEMRVDFAENQ